MPIPQKNQPAEELKFVGKFPDEFPRLPEEVIKRFPTLELWEKQVSEWWKLVRERLSDRDQNTETKVNANTNGLADLKNRIEEAGL